MNVITLLNKATQQLTSSTMALLDTEILLSHVLQCTRTHLKTWPHESVSEEKTQVFFELIQQRQQGKPVGLILGKQAFWDFEVTVTQDVLLPRPETELLVEKALNVIPEDAAWQIGDLGTGSGAIAIAIAKERPCCTLIAMDQSEKALTIAKQNALTLQVSSIEFRKGSWFGEWPFEKPCNVIVSNPPYIAEHDPHLWASELQYEPREALVSGQEGLEDIRQIIQMAKKYLFTNSYLIIEHGYNQGQAVLSLFQQTGYHNIETCQDLSGKDRITLGKC